jgi:hypothetical protein
MKTNAFLSMVFTLKTLLLNGQNQQEKTLPILRSPSVLMHCCGYYAKLEVQSAVHY